MNAPESRTNVLKLGTLWAVLFAVLMLWSFEGKAKTVAISTEQKGVTILLTDEPCKLEQVSNLPYRVVWQEGQKSYEGCWVIHPARVVVAYFLGDRTVALMPADHFKVTSEI